jgi:hypothetical protein
MLLPNTGSGKFPREHAHLEGQDDALFSAHLAMNLILNGLRCGTCVADGHRKMLSRKPAPVAQWQAERA